MNCVPRVRHPELRRCGPARPLAHRPPPSACRLEALEETQVRSTTSVGQQFARHFDYLDPALPEVAERGQRIVTFLIYLNDGFEGGETDFPRLGLRHKGEAGDAPSTSLRQRPRRRRRPDPRTLHAGLPHVGQREVAVLPNG